MSSNNNLLTSITTALSKDNPLPHQAASISIDIQKLSLNSPDNKTINKLKSDYIGKLNSWKLSNIISHQINYAIRIAASPGLLEYEEMHKLFSLCDEIHALQYCGLTIEAQEKINFEETIRTRFRKEQKKARMVAEDKIENWKKDLWWYKENLKSN
jgi:hypothetical protein